jgi:quercetin dioxygenase-like cupin family protein
MGEPQSRRPVDFVWKDQPTLSPGARFAVLFGDPTKPGLYVFRLRVPSGHRVLPHAHPEDRVYTVLKGLFPFGFGETFDSERLEEFPEGSVVYVPAGRNHFQGGASTGYEVQITGIGPTAVSYARNEDDPRRSPTSR